MVKGLILGVLLVFFVIFGISQGAEDITLNQKLNYNSDRNDGPILLGKKMDDGKVSTDKPTYIMVFSNVCYNCKRQAKRTSELYQKYQDKVKFVLIDLDSKKSKEQQDLQKKHYTGYVPHITVYDTKGKAVYDKAGEVDSKVITELLDKSILETGKEKK